MKWTRPEQDGTRGTKLEVPEAGEAAQLGVGRALRLESV